MLKAIKARTHSGSDAKIAIVASQYNARYVDAMVRAAKAELTRAGVKKIALIRVPGAFEIPVVAARLAASAQISASTNLGAPSVPGITPAPCAIICFGVIFQGQTSHAQHIGWGVTQALAQIQIQQRVPVIHAVFVFESKEHARVRCLGRKHNRGTEAARTALAMAAVMRDFGRTPL